MLMVAADLNRGLHYNFMFKNPHGSLGKGNLGSKRIKRREWTYRSTYQKRTPTRQPNLLDSHRTLHPVHLVSREAYANGVV